MFEKNQRMKLTKSARRDRCRKLLRRYPVSLVNFRWFSDKKIFTVAVPRNTQDDHIYVSADAKKKNTAVDRLLRTCCTFKQSVTASVVVSVLGRTAFTSSIQGLKYYRDVVLTRELLPEIRQYSEYFTFQQDGVPAHRARETVDLLQCETPDFISPSLLPPNSPDLNLVDYAVWGIVQDREYKMKVKSI